MVMWLDIDDAGHVGAPVWLVWRRLTDVAAWPSWWVGTSVRMDDDVAMLALQVVGRDWTSPRRWVPLSGGRRRLRVAAMPHDWNHEHAFHMTLAGDVTGEVEWWLEPTPSGTLVHHLGTVVSGAQADGPITWRAAVRRGLWGLADALALEVRDAVGLPDDDAGGRGPSM